MKKMTAMLFSLAVGLNAVSMAAKAETPKEQETDVLLIGGGIMAKIKKMHEKMKLYISVFLGSKWKKPPLSLLDSSPFVEEF